MGKPVKSKLKRNESYRFNLGPAKRKKDNNIKAKLSSNRMTIRPGFLSYGVKSTVAKKEETEENTKHENILKENLHSLFLNSKSLYSSSVRRSSRISQKNPTNYAESHTNKIKYYKPKKFSAKKIKNKCQDYSTEKFEDTSSVSEIVSYSKEDNSQNRKSLFKKIISSQAFINSSSFFKSLFTTKNQELVNDFNHNLLNKIHINLKVNVIQELRNKIFEEIGRVNGILTGQIQATQAMGSFMKFPHGNSDPEFEVPEFFFSSKEWQYATPPSQKLNLTLYEESAIQPAILYNNETGRNIYELKKDVNTNLINHINPDNIEVDKRYMEQIAEFDKENRPIRQFSKQDDKKINTNSEKFNFKPANMNQYLREHLNTVHARPKKTVKRLRFADTFSRNEHGMIEKRHCRPSTSTNESMSVDSTEMEFLLMNCLTDDSSTTESPRRNSNMFHNVNIFKGTTRGRSLFNHLTAKEDD